MPEQKNRKGKDVPSEDHEGPGKEEQRIRNAEQDGDDGSGSVRLERGRHVRGPQIHQSTDSDKRQADHCEVFNNLLKQIQKMRSKTAGED